jgi:uncharacterized LabA/DUF88 family protein
MKNHLHQTSERGSNKNTNPKKDSDWERKINDKLKVLQYAIEVSKSTIISHKLLILVDLQGIYLALHKWLSEHNFPIDNGLIISRLAHLQIEQTSKEVATRLSKIQSQPTIDLRDLFDSINIDYINGKPHLGKELNILFKGNYLDISTSFEMFYAPVPLEAIQWNLMKSAKRGSTDAIDQLRKVKLGVISRKGIFERDYQAYEDFVSNLKKSTHYSCSHEGFFGYYVGEHGLRNFDEKEVDIRIAIRFMDALHNHEADSICIISSDQDFIPLHTRADDFGITSFHADHAKFLANDNIGAKFKNINVRFIRGSIDPNWPLTILTEAMSAPSIEHFAKYNLSEEELKALCELHNYLNEIKIKLEIKPNGNASISLYRPD